VVALASIYAWYFARLSVALQDGYSTFGFDTGIFDQGVWLLSRFHAPFVTVMGRDLFGDHTSFVLLLAVPLYWLHPAPQTLLVLQSLLLAAAALPVYAVGRRLLHSTGLATLLAAAFLCNPALQRGNLDQFHPEAFLVPGIGVALYAAIASRRRLLWTSVVLCLLVKEDTALLVIPLGVWVAWRRDRRTGLDIVVVAALWAAFAYRVVIDELLGTTSFYTGRIPFGGLGGLLSTVTAHPGRFVAYLRTDQRPFYLWQLGCSTGWLWLVSPEVAGIGILTFAEDVVSDFGYMHRIDYHYTLALVPVLAIGTVWAVARLGSARRRAAATGGVTVAAVVSCALWGLWPIARNGFAYLDPSGPTVAGINEVRAALPPNAVVSAWDSYVPHVDHRLRCYEWPTPFAARYWALDRDEGRRLPFAGQVRYLFLPTHLAGPDLAVLNGIRDDFRVVRRDPEATLWKRRGP
jgi:uncharacterized membrane protein